MIMTYDFILMARQDAGLMKEIQDAFSGSLDCEVCTDIHRLHFNSAEQAVYVEAYSDSSPFAHKIIPKKIPYSSLRKMLAGDWDDIQVFDVEE